MPLISINETEIYYEYFQENNPRGTIVFLNGVMASLGSWDDFTDHFRKMGYSILLHDFRGQLKSSKPDKEISFDDHVQDLSVLLKKLKIDKVILAGTSYGGEVALCFAIKYPAIISKIVIIDSVSELDSLIKTTISSWIDTAETGNGTIFYRCALPWLYSSSFINRNMEMLKEREKMMTAIPKDYFTGQIRLYQSFLTLDITSDLKKITCPSLVICGEDDILKPPSFSRIIAANINRSEFFTIPNCGHVAIFEKPEELKTLISGFLNKS
ncbi:MAG: alpha/beta hydrolase [Spirochaetales bacterium]|nr:alpha/beta hydrolase [Spirochaetales bacterium]